MDGSRSQGAAIVVIRWLTKLDYFDYKKFRSWFTDSDAANMCQNDYVTANTDSVCFKCFDSKANLNLPVCYLANQIKNVCDGNTVDSNLNVNEETCAFIKSKNLNSKLSSDVSIQ